MLRFVHLHYLIMNYNPDTSNHYYYNSSSNYYGYGIRAVMSGNNVVGVDTTTYTNAALENVEWNFVPNGSYYKIQSAYNTNYYLRIYKSSSYADMYPASGTSYATNWNYANNKLSYYVSSSLTKYAAFFAGSGSDYGFFGANTTGSSIVLFEKVEGSAVTPDPTTPPTSNEWVPVDTITPGDEYLIGFNVNGSVYLIMNYNPNPITSSNNYYYSKSSVYYGYTAKATMNGNNIVGVTGWTDDIDHCTWKFSSAAGGKIQSAYNSSYYLSCYSSKNYADLHPSTSTSWSNWVWNASAHTLTHAYSSSTKYATFMPTIGNYSNFCYAPTSLNSTYGYVQLYKLG